MKTGKVFLVGAGPGHPDLLTVKAYRLIGEADVIVYDRLVQEECLAHARKDAERIYMGKAPGRHESRQTEISDIIARKARAGYMVVRLKGGDSLLFSRGGEEAEFLAGRGIPFEFIPGVTSALAAPAAAGIPVTHRDHSSCFCVITGHEREDESGSPMSLDWDALARMDTLAILMGVKNLSRITKLLMDHGRESDTPATLIQKAFWPDEKVLISTLGTIPEEARKAGIKPPAVLLVGSVVGATSRLQQTHRDLERTGGADVGKHVGKPVGSSMLYPIHLMLEGSRVLLVGGGSVAQRRVERLLHSGARIRLVSPGLTKELETLHGKGAIEYRAREFDPSDLDDVAIAFAATDDTGANRRVADECRRRGILINVADDPLACDFTLPACVIRDPLVISVSTNARSPGLAAAMRRNLETQFGSEWGDLTRILSDARPDLLKLGLKGSKVTSRIATVLESEALELIRTGDQDGARTLIHRILGIEKG